ncbi:MAG TPA: PmoA family protein [Bryobacteraceae bacterium]|nr:PmoA family protein [Bryobacteraceae bacterium]
MRSVALAFVYAASVWSQVEFTHLADRVAVRIDGQEFGSLYFGKEANKPFFYPLRTPSGIKVTRSFPMEKVEGEPTDHPHQKGLWMGTERLNGMDFWENDPTYKRPRMGKIVLKDVSGLRSGARSGVLTFRADWIAPDGPAVVAEKRSMTFYGGIPNARIFDIDVVFTARQEVTFDDHQDAVIGIRLSPAFDERNGGMPVNAEGLRGEAETRGKTSRYLDWQTKIGNEDVGVAILDHPKNLHAPAHWHLRHFGFFAANPFGNKVFRAEAKSLAKTLRANESLRLRYRIIVHSGAFDVEASWREFAKLPANSENQAP